MDVHFNARKIKYASIDALMDPLIRSTHIESVNVFINLDDIFHKLHRPGVNEEFEISGSDAYKQLIMNVLNLIAHYRQAFVREGWKTNVYGYYTSVFTGSFRNSLYIPSYRNHFLNIMSPRNTEFFYINKAIHDSGEIFKVISQYIDGVYVIDSQYIEPCVLPLYLSTVHPSDWNFVISKDPYDFQYSYRERWTVLYPDGEKSTSITGGNIWEYIANKECMKPIPPVRNFDPRWYSISYSVIGDKYRGIPKIKRVGWRTMYGLLQELQQTVENMCPATEMVAMVEILRGQHTTVDMVNANYASTEIELQNIRMSEIDKTIINSQLIDAVDYDNLQLMSRMYFGKYPINIPFLTDNDPDKHILKRRNPFGI